MALRERTAHDTGDASAQALLSAVIAADLDPVDVASAFRSLRDKDRVTLQADPGKSSLTRAETALLVQHGGIDQGTAATLARSTRAHRAARWARLVQESWSATDAASALRVTPSTLRAWKANGRIYAFQVDGENRYPTWQFIYAPHGGATHITVPGLATALGALPESLLRSPLAVEAWFTAPRGSLSLDGQPAAPLDWLLSDGEPERLAQVAAIADLAG